MRWSTAFLLFSCARLAGYDVLITGGRIVDGTGNSWFSANIGIDGDRIVYVGTAAPASRLTLRADGMVVAPGFIDIHSHSRDHLFDRPEAENVLRQGVTTIVEGNDGGSPVPIG
ncbi:MAG: D-aminoacylase, partial [Bryobacteraceae bacterium]